MSTLDLTSVFSTCYSLAGTEQDWFLELSSGLRPLLDQGFGVAAWTFRTRDWQTCPAVGVAPEIARVMYETGTRAPDAIAAQFFLGSRAKSACERTGYRDGLHVNPDFLELARCGIQDFAALTLVDAGGLGLAFAAPSARVLKSTSASRARLERVGSHILAGFRLRRALAPQAAVDAVLSSDGALLHAEHEARDAHHAGALRDAVKRIDRLRSRRLPTDPDEALDAWQALVSGRWSLVEQFESDGRRYLVARRNPPGALPGTVLSPLEAHAVLLRGQGASYKLVAYELDVSVATAHRLVQTGALKLGVRNHAELPWLIHACTKRAQAQQMQE